MEHLYRKLLTHLLVKHTGITEYILREFVNAHGGLIHQDKYAFSQMYEIIAKIPGGDDILANFAENMCKIPVICDITLDKFLDEYDINAFVLEEDMSIVMNLLYYWIRHRDENYSTVRFLISEGIDVQRIAFYTDDLSSTSALMTNFPLEFPITEERYRNETASLYLSRDLMFIEAGVCDQRSIELFGVFIEKYPYVYIEYTRALAMYIEMMM